MGCFRVENRRLKLHYVNSCELLYNKVFVCVWILPLSLVWSQVSTGLFLNWYREQDSEGERSWRSPAEKEPSWRRGPGPEEGSEQRVWRPSIREGGWRDREKEREASWRSNRWDLSNFVQHLCWNDLHQLNCLTWQHMSASYNSDMKDL